MQANCPQCAQKIAVDDARVPDRAFSVKCPKCQTTVRFPGRAPAGAAAPGAPAAEPPATPPPVEPPAGGAEPPPMVMTTPLAPEEMMRTQLMAQLRREMTLTTAEVGSTGRALVALPDRALAGTITVMLTRQGYAVDAIEDWDEAARLVEQGVYHLALTSRSPAVQGKETLYQRIGRLSPDSRRRLFVVLVGDEWKSGDALQAFTACADLVLHNRDAASGDALIRNTSLERTRLYQIYIDARTRHEAAG